MEKIDNLKVLIMLFMRDRRGLTCVHLALKYPNVWDALLPTLSLHPAISEKVNMKTTQTGLTPLMIAAKSGNQHQVIDLLKLGADVNLLDNDHCSALMHAVKEGHAAALETLLQCDGILVNIQDKTGDSALHWAGKTLDDYTFIIIITYSMHIEMCKCGLRVTGRGGVVTCHYDLRTHSI